MSFAKMRVAAGLTQMQVANHFGITDSAVNQWEKGKTMPKGTRLIEMAELFNCSVDDLLRPDPTT